MPPTSGIVDVHGHITPPSLLARLPMPPSLGDIDGMIEQKAAAGIGLTIVGSPVGVGTMMRVPGHAAEEQTVEVLKPFHDWLAETVSSHAGSLLAYAFCNPFGGSSVVEYAASVVRQPEFVGLIVNSSLDGRYLDSAECHEFFAMVAELDVPILLHPPAEPVGAERLDDFRLVEGVARFNDVTTGLASLVFGGRLEQYPSLKVIAGMGGGAISLLAGRLDKLWERGGPGAVNRISAPPSTFLARVYTDTTSHSPLALRGNVSVMGADHVMFGSDFPPASTPLEALIGVVKALGLSEDDEAAVLGGNARRLFNLEGE